MSCSRLGGPMGCTFWIFMGGWRAGPTRQKKTEAPTGSWSAPPAWRGCFGGGDWNIEPEEFPIDLAKGWCVVPPPGALLVERPTPHKPDHTMVELPLRGEVRRPTPKAEGVRGFGSPPPPQAQNLAQELGDFPTTRGKIARRCADPARQNSRWEAGLLEKSGCGNLGLKGRVWFISGCVAPRKFGIWPFSWTGFGGPPRDKRPSLKRRRGRSCGWVGPLPPPADGGPPLLSLFRGILLWLFLGGKDKALGPDGWSFGDLLDLGPSEN